MPLEVLAPELHELGPFDEAKRLLDEAAAQSLVPIRIVLIMETAEDVFTIHTGEPAKPSAIAGLCFMAAQTVCE